MASPDAPLVRAVTWYLPWLAPFADLASGSPEWHDLERRLPPLRLRLGVEVRISNSGLLCQVPVGPPYPFATVPAGTILRFAKLSHGTEEASSWMGPPAPVFAVEDGPAAGSCLAFYLEWLRAEDVDLGAAIEVISESSLGRAQRTRLVVLFGQSKDFVSHQSEVTTVVTMKPLRDLLRRPAPSMIGTAEGYWSSKRHLLELISKRIARDTISPANLIPAADGTAFAPVMDLVVRRVDPYGWFPDGLADASTPIDMRLRRGTRIVLVGGDQEQCPGGPGENLHFLRVEPDGTTSPWGRFTFPQDLRVTFGANLAEHLLVRFGEPVLSAPARLAAIADDVERLIAEASPLAFGVYERASRSAPGEDR